MIKIALYTVDNIKKHFYKILHNIVLTWYKCCKLSKNSLRTQITTRYFSL